MKRSVLLLAAALLGTVSPLRAEVDPAVLKAEDQRVAAMAKASVTVLSVFASSGRGGGSGVVISPDGFALTNFHVVKPCGNAMKCGMADGKVYDAVLVGVDPTGDVALVKLFGRDDFPAAELGNSDRVQAGDWVFAMGNPFLLATDFQPTVTYGIVSGTHRYQFPAGTLLEYADCIQTDASINPGNSGGPLFDAEGRLIGINGRGSFEKRGRVNVGVGYAISINQIKNFLGYLHSGRIVDHATLGATVAFDDNGRVVVSDILSSSDAYRRGLRYDDEIISFGGRPISTPNGFKNVLGIFPKGWRVPLSFVHDGQRYDVTVRLAGVHRTEELIKKTAGRRRRHIPMPIPKPAEKPKPGEKPKAKETKPAEKPKTGGAKPAEKPKPGEKPKAKETKPAEKPKTGGAKPPEKPKPAEKPKTEGPKPAKQPKIEKPKPAGKPKPKIQGRQIPIPIPGGPHRMPIRPPAPMPEIVKKHFEAKPGYANYYYNKLSRGRIWKAWTARADCSSLGGTWTITGKLDSGTQFKLLLTDTDAALKLPTKDFKWTLTEELGTSLQPQHSGGMLPALHLLRRLAVLGPGKFGDVSYLGTVPVAGRQDLADVLVGIHAGVECRFIYDPSQGHLLALEFFPEEHVDPCEIFFSGYHEVDGRFLPERMEVRYGDTVFGVFKLEEFELEEAETTMEPEKPKKPKEPEKGEKPEKVKKPGESKKAEKSKEAEKPREGEKPNNPEKTAEK